MEEYQILEKSIENTYKFLVEKKSFEEIIIDKNGDIHPMYFYIEPNSEYSNEDLDAMIEFYADLEEYEKCHQLKLLKKEENLIAGVDFTDSLDQLKSLSIFK